MFLLIAQVIYANISITNYDSLSWVDTPPFEGNVNEVYSGLAAGEFEGEGFYENWSFSNVGIVTGVVNIDLPEIPEGMILSRATLIWAVTVYDPEANPSLGNLLLYHSQPPLLPGATGDYVGVFANPTVPDGYLGMLDVTSSVLSDYNFDGSSAEADFQFKADGIGFNDDGRVSAYLLRDLQPDYPQGTLNLEFAPVPEPQTSAFALAFIALALTIITRQSTQRR